MTSIIGSDSECSTYVQETIGIIRMHLDELVGPNCTISITALEQTDLTITINEIELRIIDQFQRSMVANDYINNRRFKRVVSVRRLKELEINYLDEVVRIRGLGYGVNILLVRREHIKKTMIELIKLNEEMLTTISRPVRWIYSLYQLF